MPISQHIRQERIIGGILPRAYTVDLDAFTGPFIAECFRHLDNGALGG